MTDHVDVPVYLQVQPEFYGWDHQRQRHYLRGAAMVRATQGAPAKPIGGTLLVKVMLRIDREAFYPLSPSAVVVIPADLTQVTPIEVVAVNPGEET